MKKTDKQIKKILNDIMYPESYGWPPVCSALLYQPERPVMSKRESTLDAFEQKKK